jgi:nitrile hydratase beta subunit-like protein
VTLEVGRRVRVSPREHRGHHRTPGYLKGRVGTIERYQGSFTNPETRAYGDSGLPERRLFLVRFDNGAPIYADIYEHWLEEAE